MSTSGLGGCGGQGFVKPYFCVPWTFQRVLFAGGRGRWGIEQGLAKGGLPVQITLFILGGCRGKLSLRLSDVLSLLSSSCVGWKTPKRLLTLHRRRKRPAIPFNCSGGGFGGEQFSEFLVQFFLCIFSFISRWRVVRPKIVLIHAMMAMSASSFLTQLDGGGGVGEFVPLIESLLFVSIYYGNNCEGRAWFFAISVGDIWK